MNPVERYYMTKAHVQEIHEIAEKVTEASEGTDGGEFDRRTSALWHLQRAAEILGELPTPVRDLTTMLNLSIFDRLHKRSNPAPGSGANDNAG